MNKRSRICEFDIIIFFRQLSILFSSSIPLIKCFEVLENSQTKNSIRFLIYSIKRELLSGKDLYFSLRCYPQYFDEMTCQLIKIGDYTGKLDVMLTMIANEKEKYFLFKKEIIKSLFYPFFIVITAMVVVIGMFLFVIPRFAEMFSNSQIKLSKLTRLLFFLSHQLQQHMFVFTFLFCLFIILLLPISISIRIRKYIFQSIIKLPVMHSFIQKTVLAKFSRNLAIAYTAGIPINQALKLITYANNNMVFTCGLISLRQKINSGLQLHQAMSHIPYFPSILIQMVKIGEESGRIDHLLNKVADIFAADSQLILNQFTQFLEPLIMLVLGVLIGGIVIGMYLPILQLGKVF